MKKNFIMLFLEKNWNLDWLGSAKVVSKWQERFIHTKFNLHKVSSTLSACQILVNWIQAINIPTVWDLPNERTQCLNQYSNRHALFMSFGLCHSHCMTLALSLSEKIGGFQLCCPLCFVALLQCSWRLDETWPHRRCLLSFFAQPSRLSIFERSLKSPYQPSLRVIWRRPLVWTAAAVPAQPSHPLSLAVLPMLSSRMFFFGARCLFFAETSERRFGSRWWAQGPERCALRPSFVVLGSCLILRVWRS